MAYNYECTFRMPYTIIRMHAYSYLYQLTRKKGKGTAKLVGKKMVVYFLKNFLNTLNDLNRSTSLI